MKPSEIIKLARRQTGCTEDIVTEEEAYRFLNFIIEDFWAEIRNSDSWFGFDELAVDVYAWQITYSFSNPDDETNINWFPLSKIQSVWLLDTKTWKFQDLPVHFVDKVDINSFISNEKTKVCFITNNEINLIPAPKENTLMLVWGFVYNPELQPDIWYITVWWDEYARSPNDDVTDAYAPYSWRYWDTLIYTRKTHPTTWNATYSDYQGTTTAWNISSYRVEIVDNEDYIWIPKRWHSVIVEGMKYWMYGNMWVNFETARANSRAFYDSEKNKAIQNIMDRWQLSDTAYFPNLNYLNY